MDTRRIASIAVFTSLIVVGGLISVPIPFTQVQLSFQTVFVVLAGMFLGGRDGALSVLIYIVMGLLGLPVFTQGGGVGYILMPSFGYLIGFPVGALLTGAILSKSKKHTRGRAFAAALLGMIPIYAIGIAYQVSIVHFYLGYAWAAAIAGVPAILVLAVKDGVLCGLAACMYPSVRRAIRSRRSKRNAQSAECGQIIQYRR